MNGLGTIRKVLTAMLAMAMVLWAEAGLALLSGDQVLQCRAMMMHGHAQAMAAADDAAVNADDSEAISCCPADPSRVPKVTSSHPQCCSNSDVPERPLLFLAGSERPTPHPLDIGAQVSGDFAPPLAQHSGELRGADAPRFVKPVLDLKSDLRI